MAAIVSSTELKEKYKNFIENCSDPNSEPISVFWTLTQKQLDEIILIRELSVQLQAKKDEDMKKAAEAAADVVESKEAEKEEDEAEENQVTDENKTE